MWSLSPNNLHRNFFWVLCLLLPVQLGYHFWPLSSYVMGLRIDYLSPTIYLTDLLVVLVLGLWIWEEISRVGWFNVLRIAYRVLRSYWWVLAFFVYLLVNALLAQNPGAALYKFAKIVEFSLLGLYVAKNSCVSHITYRVLPFTLVYSSLIAIAQFVKQSSLGGLFWWLGERTFNAATPGIAKTVIDGELIMRPYAAFPHPNVLAGFLLVGLILTVPYFFQKQKFLTTCYVLLVTFAVIFSFSRSVWLVGLLLLFFWLFRKKKLFLVVSCLLLVISIFILGSNFSTDEAVSQRLQLIKAAVLMIQSNPLSGVGLNNFLIRLPEFWGPIGTTFWLQPVHNIYLLVAAETGIVGLLIFIWFSILTVKKLLIINSKLLIALSSILLLGLFDHYWLTLQQTQLLLAIVLGLSWGRRPAVLK